MYHIPFQFIPMSHILLLKVHFHSYSSSHVVSDAVSLDDALKVCSALLVRVKLSWPWQLRLYSPLKHGEILVHWHRIISLKTWIFSYTAFRTSNLSCWLICMFSSMTSCLVCMKALRRSLQEKTLGYSSTNEVKSCGCCMVSYVPSAGTLLEPVFCVRMRL